MIHSYGSTSTFETALKRNLRSERFGKRIRFYDSIDSTNTAAMVWAYEGAPEGALVCTDHQTGGRGRQGRLWKAEPAKNLLMSLVLRPKFDASSWGLINLAASVAIVKTLNAFIAPLTAAIKWPNDVLINGRKCCGVLIETVTTGGARTKGVPLILGIGINVNQATFPEEIERNATSLLLETGRHLPRVEILGCLLQALEQHYEAILADAETLIDAYERDMLLLNQSSRFQFSGKQETLQGVIRGVSSSGALRFETPEGERLLHAGEVTSHREASSQFGLS